MYCTYIIVSFRDLALRDAFVESMSVKCPLWNMTNIINCKNINVFQCKWMGYYTIIYYIPK